MATKNKFRLYKTVLTAAAGVLLGWGSLVRAQVSTIVIDSQASAYGGAAVGNAGPYVTLKGRVFGEVDPSDPHNQIIQDLALAPRDGNGKAQYITTFQITMPASPGQSTGLMFYEVSNRGGNAIPSTAASVVPGAIYLESSWQGDLLAHCTTDYPCTSLASPFAGTTQVIQVPVAKNSDGSTITGRSMATSRTRPATRRR